LLETSKRIKKRKRKKKKTGTAVAVKKKKGMLVEKLAGGDEQMVALPAGVGKRKKKKKWG